MPISLQKSGREDFQHKAQLTDRATAQAATHSATDDRAMAQAANRSEALLAGVAEATRRLLATEDFDLAVNRALEAIARSASIDRIFIFKHHPETATVPAFATCPYEWTAEGIPVSREVPDRFPMVYGEIEGFSEWLNELKAGLCVQKTKDEMSAAGQAIQDIDQALSVLTVPIFVEGEYWGNFGFDDCATARVWEEAEIATLETAASTFAAALQRRGSEETLRSRDVLLNSVNAAARSLVANENLAEAIPAALRILGEGTQQDRVYVFENVYPQGADGVFWQIPYEWAAAGFPAVASIAEKLPIAMSDFPDWLMKPFLMGGAVQVLARDLEGAALEINKAGETKALIAVPIQVAGRWWGVLGFDDCTHERVWSEGEVAVLETAAACIGSAIERDQIQRAREQAERAVLLEREKAARDRANELAQTNEAVSRTLSILATNPNPDSFLCLLVQELSEMLGAHNTGLFLYSEADNTLSRYIAVQDGKAYRGSVPRDTEVLQHPIPADSTGTWQTIVESERPITFAEMDALASNANSLWWKSTIDWHVQEGHRECAFARLKVGDIPVGFIGFCFKEHQTFSVEQLELIQSLANQATLSIHLTRLAEEARQTAISQEQEKAARDRANELAKANEAIGQTLISLTETPELDDFLCQILNTISESVDACKAHLFLYKEESHTLHQHVVVQDGQAFKGAAPDNPEMFRHPIPADISGGWEIIATSEKPFTMDERHPENEALFWPESVPWHQEQGHLSATCACMKVGSKPIGFIGFAFRHLPVLTDGQLEFIQALTNQATLSIHLTRLAEEVKATAVLKEQEKAARDRASELASANEAISQTLIAFTENPELDEFLGEILNTISAPINACKAHMFLYDEESDTLRQNITVQDGQIYKGTAPGDPEMFHHPIPADLSGAWKAIATADKPLTMDERNPINDEQFWPETVPWHKEQGHLSATCVCMRAGNKPIGFIGFSFRHLPVLTDGQFEFMQALTNQATLAIHLTRLAEEVKATAVLKEQEKAARDRANELAKTNEVINQTLTALAANPETDAFLGLILQELTKQTGACKAHLYIYDAATHTLEQHCAVQDGQLFMGSAPGDPEMFKAPIPADLTHGWQAISNSPLPLTSHALNTLEETGENYWWPETLPWHHSEGHREVACSRMKVGDVPIGYIGFAFKDGTKLSLAQLEFIQTLTNQATLSIYLTRLAEEAKQTALLQAQEKSAREKAQQLAKANEAISQTLTALTATPELDDFLGRNLNKMAEYMGACKAHIFLYDEPTDTLTQYITVQDGQIYQGYAPTDPLLLRNPVPANLTDAWETIKNSNKPLVLDANHPETAKSYWPGTLEWHQEQGHLSSACVCMKIGESAIGWIGFAFRNVAVLSDEQLEFLQALTNQTTLSIRLTQLAEEGKTAALSIALTEERNRLAREIHDTLAQAFTGVSLQLEAAKDYFEESPEDALYHINRAGGLARGGLSEARRSVRALRSQALTTDTLPNALRTALTEMTKDSDVTPHVRVVGKPFALPDDIQTNLLRIGQEAATNVLRHAEADNLHLVIAFEPARVRMTIRDDGKGCDISLDEVDGFGLLGMQERVLRFDGKFSFVGTPGEGTVIDIAIPV